MTERMGKILPVTGLLMLFGVVWHYVWMSGDGWWYLALGRAIFKCRCLPEFNDLVFTGCWTRVIHQQWLPYIILYGAYKAGGYTLVYALTAALIAVGLAGIMAAAKYRGASWTAIIIVLLPGVFMLWQDLTVRSESFIDMLFGVEVWLIMRVRSGKRAPWWLLAPIFMFWANSHSSLPLAVVYPIVVGVGWWADKRRGEADGGYGKGAIWLVIAVASTLVNPYGTAIYKDIVSRLLSTSVNVIEIFKSPDFHDPLILVMGIWMLLLWVGLFLSPRRPNVTDIAVAGAFTLMFLNAQRYFVFLLFGAAPVMAFHWDAIVTSIRRPATDDSMARFRKPVLKAAVSMIFLLVAITLFIVPRRFEDSMIGDVQKVADSMAKAGIKGHVFNYYTWGGFLLWSHPEMKIFIDGRNNIYEESGIFDDYRSAAHGGRYWKEIFDLYGIDAVIFPKWDLPLPTALNADPDWKIFYTPEMGPRNEAVVFLRATPENLEIIRRFQ